MTDIERVYQSISFGIIVSCLAIIIFLIIKLQQRKKAAAAAGGRSELKVSALRDADLFRYKLNPHLLKNALNAIQSHAYQSYYALDKLSNVLDYILYESDGEFVLLKDELQFALNLIEINRLKTSPLFDLHIRNKISTDHPLYEKLKVPPFITINPIENAFKHADLQSDDAFISVIFELKEDFLLLSVANKISLGSKHTINGGFGNRAFRERLQALYGDDFELKVNSDGKVHTSSLKLKLYAGI